MPDKDEFIGIAEEIVEKSFDIGSTIEVLNKNGFVKTALEYKKAKDECVCSIETASSWKPLNVGMLLNLKNGM